MTRFSNTTVAELVDALDFRTHASIDEFLLRFDIQQANRSGGIAPRCIAITQYLCAQQHARGPTGGNIIIEVVEYLLDRRVGSDRSWAYTPEVEQLFPKLLHSLKRDGYVIEKGTLQRLLPETLNLPEVEDELTISLREMGFSTTLGHLVQARDAHTRGDWAAANAQLRTFMESLCDEIFEQVVGTDQEPVNSHARRERLSRTDPPFFSADLNEWEPGGKGFVQGLWRRLNPAGSHPGLSDEEDSTFRLHLCLLVAGHFVRRLKGTKHYQLSAEVQKNARPARGLPTDDTRW